MLNVSVIMSFVIDVSTAGRITLLHHHVANASVESSMMRLGQANEYGQIATLLTASTITIDNFGNINAVGMHKSLEGLRLFGRFNIIGKDGQHVVIALPESGFKVYHVNGIDEINIDLVTYNVPSILVGGSGVLNISGEVSFTEHHVPGIYVGNYTVTVTYS